MTADHAAIPFFWDMSSITRFLIEYLWGKEYTDGR
jgi:hypothetical protein